MRVGQAGFLRPGIKLRLHLGEVAFRLHFSRNVEPGVAQARDYVLRGDETVPADEAQEHLPGVAAKPAAALAEQVEQADLVRGRPFAKELAEAAVFPSDLLHKGGIVAN